MNRLLTFFILCLTSDVMYAEPAITDIRMKGSLEATRQVDCVALDKLDNTYTPADLYPGVAKCIQQGDYEKGARLFALAGVYGCYDAYRVIDRTAHQGVRVLLLNSFGTLSMEKKQAFQKTLHTVFEQGSATLHGICNRINKIGHPGYYPGYMVLHGMGAFTGNAKADPLVKNFDAAKAWNKALDSYLHCPVKVQRE